MSYNLQFTVLCAQRCAVCQNFDRKIRRDHLKFFYEHPDYESEDEIAYFGLYHEKLRKKNSVSKMLTAGYSYCLLYTHIYCLL